MTRRLLAALALMLIAMPALAETKAFGQGSWQRITEAHRDRPLVVHLWSLTCAPCLVELPHWRDMIRRHPDLDVVFVATDPLEETPRLERALARAGLAGRESWAFADPFVERLRFEIDRSWHGELPITRLIATDGSVETVTGNLDEARLGQWLKARAKP